MGIQRTTTVTYTCDECGTVADPTAIDPAVGWPDGWLRLFDAGWIRIAEENIEGTLLCGWACLRDYAAGKVSSS